MMAARTTLCALLALTVGCVAETAPVDLDEVGALSSSLSSAQRRARAAQIRDAAADNGITEGYLLAGIADAETTMAHCHSELVWACRGPHSADCGGPVVAGAGDGPCSLMQGGLGMFQFDAGTYSQTLAREGDRILSVAGNVAAAVDFVVNMVIRSAYVPGVDDRAQAVAWINGVRVGNGRWDAWIRTVTHYYNGCAPSYSCFSSRYARYRDHTSGVFNEMGASFWNVSRCEASCLSGTRIRGADCGEGDCAVFGATCVDDDIGARCVSVFCEPRGESHGCLPDGDTLVTCQNGAPTGQGSCGAFGATCVDDELGARCVSVFCPARGSEQACLPDGRTIITCDDGGIAGSGDCGAFGATCVDDELGARCVSVFCDARGAHDTCLPDGTTLARCQDGGFTGTVDCAAEGATCVADEAGARCVSRYCEPTGTATVCGGPDVMLTCNDGAIEGSVDCSEEGGHCVDDAAGVRCVTCPEEGSISRCLGDATVELCRDGEATALPCGGGEVCVDDGGLARCAAPTEPVDPTDPGPTDPGPTDPTDPDPTDPDPSDPDPTDPRDPGMLEGGCAVGARSSSRAPLALVLLGLALVTLRRRG